MYKYLIFTISKKKAFCQLTKNTFYNYNNRSFSVILHIFFLTIKPKAACRKN